MADFTLDPDFEKAFLRGAEMRAMLEPLVEEGAARYRDGVPVATGDLQDSVFGDVALTAEGWKGRVGATDWKAGLVEFGTSKNRPNGALRRAIESLGLTFKGQRG